MTKRRLVTMKRHLYFKCDIVSYFLVGESFRHDHVSHYAIGRESPCDCTKAGDQWIPLTKGQ